MSDTHDEQCFERMHHQDIHYDGIQLRQVGLSDGDRKVLKKQIIFNDVGDVKFKLKEPTQNFVGRSQQLQQLHSLLSVKTQDTVVLNGISGVGKSEFANAYCHKYSIEYDGNVIFANCETEGTLESFFVDFAKYIGVLSPNDTNQSMPMKVLIQHVYNFLSKINCLIIFENADEIRNLDEFLPQTCSKMLRKIIIITQFQQWQNFEKLELLPLEEKESMQLFQNELGQNFNSLQCKKLIDSISCLPLACQSASSFINARNISVSEFLENHDKTLKEIWSAKDLPTITSNEKAMLATWKMFFDNSDNNPFTMRLLRVLSLMDGKSINVELLRYLENCDKLKLEESLHCLTRYSLIGSTISSVDENDSCYVNTHNLFQKFIRSTFEEQEQELKVLSDLFQMCYNCITKIDEKDQQEFRDMWLKHIFSGLQKITGKYQSTQVMINVIDHAVTTALNSGKFKLALTFISNCKRKLFENSHLLRSYEAKILFECREYVESANIYQEILDARVSAFGIDHLPKLETKYQLGRSLECQVKYDEAADIYKEVLNSRISLLGRDHNSTLATKHSLAGVLKKLGKYDESIHMYNEVLSSRLTSFGHVHIDTIKTKECLAVVLETQGKYDKAFYIYNDVLNSEITLLGHNHPSTLETKTKLSRVLQKQGKYNKAFDIDNEILNAQIAVFGHDHFSTLSSKHNLANSLQQQGKYDQAFDIYSQVLTAQKTLLGDDHHKTLTTKNNLALVLQRQGKIKEAFIIYTEVLNSRISLLGQNHTSTLLTKNNLAANLHKQGKDQEAFDIFNDVLNVKLASLGHDHSSTLVSKQNLAGALQKKGEYEKAIALYHEVLESQIRSLGPDHRHTLITKQNLEKAKRFKDGSCALM